MVFVSLATEQDLETASDIMTEAALWLMRQGTPLWKPAELTVERLRPYVENEELAIARSNLHGAPEPAGTIIVQDEDPLFWPEVDGEDSVFFHKLVVRRRFAGSGVADALIDHAIDCGKARGKKFLRMDYSVRHPRLRDFYEDRGFEFVDEKQVGPYLVARMFLPIS